MGNVKCCEKYPLKEKEIIKTNDPKDISKNNSRNTSKNNISLNKSLNNKFENSGENENITIENFVPKETKKENLNLRAKPQNKNQIIPQIKLEKSAKKIQSVYRAYQIRKNYETKIKPELKEEENNLIKKKLLELSKTNPNIKTDNLNTSQNSYNSKEWEKHYNSNDSFFNYNYGNTIKNQCQINKTESNKIELYQGSINLNNEKQGFGTLTTEDKILTGFWRENKFTGWGKEKNTNGDILEGKFINGKLNGKGIYKNNIKGIYYNGDYKNGLKEGKGKEKNSKFEYEGEYKNDKLNGKGKIKFNQKNCEYEGDFKNNNIFGYGIFKWENGEIYEGNLNNGCISGRGKYTYPDGQIYEGDYVRGIKQGFGKLTFPNGNIYEGPFDKGLPNGIGKFTKNGKVKNVEFNYGNFVKVVN